ncbi:MAG: hypothetical protein IPK16_15015 [Anaerolineales bacterium]|nr:hypothetical protein [Anaerolineales bacterium]
MESEHKPEAQPNDVESAGDAFSDQIARVGDRILSTQTEVSRFDRWVEFLAAVVLSLATVATAWAGYQAAMWGGEQTRHTTAATTANMQAALQTNIAQQRGNLQATLFVQWATAMSEENTELADFLYARFPKELRVATDAWIATKPRENPDAPGTPFEMKEFSLPETARAAEFSKQAEDESALADAANDTSDHYILLTVIFASVLFFGGISGKFQSKFIDLAMLVMAGTVFLVALGVLATYPVQ